MMLSSHIIALITPFFRDILNQRDLFERDGFDRVHRGLENLAVTLRGLAQDLQNGATPPCLPAYHEKAIEWTVAKEVATFVLYAVVRVQIVISLRIAVDHVMFQNRWLCCADKWDRTSGNPRPSGIMYAASSFKELMEEMAIDAVVVLSAAEAAATRYWVSSNLLEAADSSGLLHLGDRGTADVLIRVMGRPEDVVGIMARWSRRREDSVPQQFALSYMAGMVKVLVRDDQPEIPAHILRGAEDDLEDTLTMARARIEASSPITDADSEPEGQ